MFALLEREKKKDSALFESTDTKIPEMELTACPTE
jgi:hypothetical protein